MKKFRFRHIAGRYWIDIRTEKFQLQSTLAVFVLFTSFIFFVIFGALSLIF